MPDLDVIVRGGNVVTPTEVSRADIGIADGRIVVFAPEITQTTREVIDATRLHIFPGVIDAHVHFNEPGRTHWEGFVTGSRALAAGGATTFFDMPLNSSPPTLDGPSFDAKLAAAKAGSLVDFALWGGLVPQNLDQLEELHGRGVIGFKAFMSNSGIEDFSCVDDDALRSGMKRVASFGGIVAVHAESEAMTQQLTHERLAKGQTSIRDYLDSRPIAAELDAIRRAIQFAGEMKCALHIVHISCGEGVALVAEAQRRGVDVTCETCPHYLVLTDQDLEQLGAVAKCAPPLRTAAVQEELWQCIFDGRVTTIGSDHSPSPVEMKQSAPGDEGNFLKLWGGIAGGQHTLELMLARFPAHALPLLSRLTSCNVAKRFRLQPTKGGLTVGADADLALVDLNRKGIVRREDLLDRHRLSPYVGRPLKGRVVRTILRGRTVAADGRIVSQPAGRLIKPTSK
jgi:allantoinase